MPPRRRPRPRSSAGEAATDWRDVIARDDIDIVDICTPGDSHVEIAIAALAAGKHVLCEKPLANTVEEAREMAEAARAAAGAVSARWSGSATAACPRSAWRAQLVPRADIGEMRQARAASTCRTGSSTRTAR